jgi:hypothetical protein
VISRNGSAAIDMSTSEIVWQLSDVAAELDRSGYERIAGSYDNGGLQNLSSTLWYLSPKSTAAVEQYVVFENK